LTPNSRKEGEVDTSELPPELAKIVSVWPELPGYIRQAIKVLVSAAKGTGNSDRNQETID